MPPISWPLTLLDNAMRPVEWLVLAAHRQVHIIPPSGLPCIVPPQADEDFCEAIRQARAAVLGQAADE